MLIIQRKSTLRKCIFICFSVWLATTLYFLSKLKPCWFTASLINYSTITEEVFFDPRAGPINSTFEAYGEMGKPVILPKELSPKIKDLIKEGYAKYGYNQYVSDLISLHRTLPDIRHPWCVKEAKYVPKLPATSVIICFFDEAWTVLLRTVHSVLEQSPPHLIKEIILVDDQSTMPELKQQLADYLAIYPKVKIVRTLAREGLIRARIIGAQHATGPVLTFLDAHCECTKGWLEPLLDRIARKNTSVVCPVIDVIDVNNLQYHYNPNSPDGGVVAGFSWHLYFNWVPIPEREKKRRAHSAMPLYSPAMAGGLFAISRSFFFKLGAYDNEFKFWGAENLELSFKTWMCGGTLEIIPCSHVGHIYRPVSRYPQWNSGWDVIKRNFVRLAKVWMDEFADFFFRRINFKLGDYGNISSRIELRKRNGCKSFRWFLENVYPEAFLVETSIASGELRNQGYGNDTCLDFPSQPIDIKKPIGLFKCHRMGGNQEWIYTRLREIRRDDSCFDFTGLDIVLFPCHGQKGNQEWSYDPNTNLIQHVQSGLCLIMLRDRRRLLMDDCNKNLSNHRWTFQKYNASNILKF